MCEDGGRVPAGRALRLPPLPQGATFGQHYDIMLVVDSREQVSEAFSKACNAVVLRCGSQHLHPNLT